MKLICPVGVRQEDGDVVAVGVAGLAAKPTIILVIADTQPVLTSLDTTL